MMKKLVFAILVLLSAAHADSSTSWTPFLQQTAIYFSSDRVTLDGLGVGIGAQFSQGKILLAQADVNILWINGNALATRLAIGAQRDGRWSPAVFTTFGLLGGQRTEVLSETGQRPAEPVWILGLRAAPLRFKNYFGHASALELGYGLGPDHGRHLEITILSAGVNW